MKSMKSKLLITAFMAMFIFGGQVMAREAESGSGSSGNSSSNSSSNSSTDDNSTNSADDNSVSGNSAGTDDNGVSGRSSNDSTDDNGTDSGMEVEVEHGVTTLKPHGGEDDATRTLRVHDDSGMEVETEHGVTFLKPHGGTVTAANTALMNQVKGRILLQVEKHGEAWFVEPTSGKIAFLGRPDDAFKVMREFGLGIKNDDLNKIAEAGDDKGSDAALANRLSGKILLQVEDHGEAWFVDPVSKKRHFLGRPEDAFRIMRNLGLGITDDNLAKLAAEK